jgi:hypothetical protein
VNELTEYCEDREDNRDEEDPHRRSMQHDHLLLSTGPTPAFELGRWRHCPGSKS